MKYLFALATLAMSGAAIAQTAPTVVTIHAADPAATSSTLPASTDIWVALEEPMNSKTDAMGHVFPVSVSRDVMLGNNVVIPRGTKGHGQITYRTGKGAFGKSAKLEFDLTDLQIEGHPVPLAGHYRIEGTGNTGAAVGAVVAVGVFGAFVTGHSATANVGSEWRASTKEPIVVALVPAVAIAPAAVPPVSPVAAK